MISSRSNSNRQSRPISSTVRGAATRFQHSTKGPSPAGRSVYNRQYSDSSDYEGGAVIFPSGYHRAQPSSSSSEYSLPSTFDGKFVSQRQSRVIDYSLPTLTHDEKNKARNLVAGLAGIGSGQSLQGSGLGSMGCLEVEPLQLKGRSRSASRLPSPTPALFATAPQQSDHGVMTIKDGRRRSRSVSKIIQKDAEEGEYLRAMLNADTFQGGRKRSNSFTPLPPQQADHHGKSLQAKSQTSSQISGMAIRQRAKSVSRGEAEVYQAAMPSFVQETQGSQATLPAPRTRARAHSHCPPPAPGMASPDLYEGPHGHFPSNHQGFDPSQTMSSFASPTPKSQQAAARASALASLERPSYTPTSSSPLSTPGLSWSHSHGGGQSKRDVAPSPPTLKHQSSHGSLHDAPRRPPRSARRISILPQPNAPWQSGHALASPIARSPLATSTPVFAAPPPDRERSLEWKRSGSPLNASVVGDGKDGMDSPSTFQEEEMRLQMDAFALEGFEAEEEGDEVHFEMVNSPDAPVAVELFPVPVRDPHSAIETWRRLADTFGHDGYETERDNTFTRTSSTIQSPPSRGIMKDAPSPGTLRQVNLISSSNPGSQTASVGLISGEREQVEKHVDISNKKERSGKAKVENKRVSVRKESPFVSEKPVTSTTPQVEDEATQAPVAQVEPFRPYVWASPQIQVEEDDSPAEHETPIPGAFPEAFRQALDALDQPLAFDGEDNDPSGAPIRPYSIMDTTSPSKHLANFAAGLGLYIPDMESLQAGPSCITAHPPPAMIDSEGEEESEMEEDKEFQDRSSNSSDCFESADEGSEKDWQSRRGSRISIGWYDAAEAFERQHRRNSKRGSVSWRSSVRLNIEKRKSALSFEAVNVTVNVTGKRLSTGARVRQSTALPLFDQELCIPEEPTTAQQEGDMYRVESPERAPTPALSQPATNSTVEEDPEQSTPITPLRQLHRVSLQAQGESKVDDHSNLDAADPFVGGADSDPEEHRLSTYSGVSRRRESSRRWSAIPPGKENAVSFIEDAELDLDGGPRRSVVSQRRSSKRASKRVSSIGRKGPNAEERRSVQAKKRLTQLLASTPVQLVEPPSHCSWRTHLARGEYEGLLEFWGPKEMHRQEVIWELAETEKSFVQSMCSLQKIFALPLKTPEGRWIDGVPCSVARLFDWLEDILQLHSKISNALQRARNQQTQDSHPSRVILHVADCVLRYVPRLEVHQPYLVRFESVTAMIEEMLHSEDSVFGQFVNMQMQLPECGNMSFSSFLLKPVQRLMKYPLFFKQLYELTPPEHPDHAATDTLNQTTSQLIRDLNDVKAREEDYQALKDLESRISGLPEPFFLATRERRLLRQGAVRLLQLSDKERVALGLDAKVGTPSPPLPKGPSRDSYISPNPTKVGNTEFRPLNLLGGRAMTGDLSNRRLSRTAFEPNRTAGRDSIWSEASSFSAASSFKSANATPEGLKNVGFAEVDAISPSSTNGNLNNRPESIASSISISSATMPYGLTGIGKSRSPQAESFTVPLPLPPRSLSRKPSMASMLLRSGKSLAEKERETSLQAFVFSDLVMLATTNAGNTAAATLDAKGSKARRAKSPTLQHETVANTQSKYTVLEKMGLARVLNVVDHSGKLQDKPHLLEIELLPLKVDALNSTLYDKRPANGGGSSSLFISFSTPAGEHPSFKSAENDCAQWLKALERSFITSLRSSKQGSSQTSRRNNRSSFAEVEAAPVHNAHADWARRAAHVTELVMAAAKAGDRSNLVALLQSGLPFPKSPSQQNLVQKASEELNKALKGDIHLSPSLDRSAYGSRPPSAVSSPNAEKVPSSPQTTIAVVGDGVLDEVDEEREERRWWALRLAEVRKEHESEKEIEEIVQQLRSDSIRDQSFSDFSNSSATFSEASPSRSNNTLRRKVRQGLPVVHTPPSATAPTMINGAGHLSGRGSPALASSSPMAPIEKSTRSGGLLRSMGTRRK